MGGRFSLISFAVAVRVRMCCPLCFPVEAAESGCYVGTLDYTKAFDMVRPEKACILLEYHGCPAPLAKALGSLWGSQGRFLFFAGVLHEGLVPAGSSLPQGDPFSVLSLALLLRIPGLKAQSQFDPTQVFLLTTVLSLLKVRMLVPHFGIFEKGKANEWVLRRVQKGPPKRAVQRIEAPWRRVGVGLTCALAKLLKLLTGHHSDLEFSACLQLFSSVWRFVRAKGRCFRNWDTSLVAQRLYDFFDSLGFHNPEPWVWDGPARVSLAAGSLGVLHEQLHFIREAWRAKMWRAHEDSGRRDATGEPYDEALAKRARQMAERGQHHLAVLSGAYVSLAGLSIMKRDPELASCPHCGKWEPRRTPGGNVRAGPTPKGASLFVAMPSSFWPGPQATESTMMGFLKLLWLLGKLTWASGIYNHAPR